jgi:hypothetical protein
MEKRLYLIQTLVYPRSDKTTFMQVYRETKKMVLKRTGYDKTSFRLNVDHKFSDDIKLSLVSNYINSSADRGFL